MFAFISPVYAENALNESDIYIKTNPSDPKVEQNIIVSIESYGIDLNKAKISWFVNKKIEKVGIGVKEISLKTGKGGSITNVDVQIQTKTGQTIKKTLAIKPTGGINIIWEANTLTPPFYKGKALNTSEAQIKVVALPDFVNSSGTQVDPKKLIYKWEKDYKVIPNSGGYGKNSVIINNPLRDTDFIIRVTVDSADDSLQSKSTLTIRNATPKIEFYEVNPVLGPIFEKSLNNRSTLQEDEVKIMAFPYFFSLQNTNDSDISYKWLMNDRTVENVANNEIIFRRTQNIKGFTKISLSIQNLNKIMQFSSNSFNINYEPKEVSTSFGL